MKLPSPSRYPKRIYFHGEEYRVKFVKRFKDKDQVGEYDSSRQLIRIKKGLTPEETLMTFIHELLHLVELEGPVKIRHKQVYALSEALTQVFVENL